MRRKNRKEKKQQPLKWTENMRRALVFIVEYINTNGQSPTQAEVVDAMGYCAKIMVKRVVRDLMVRGYIDKIYRQPRGLRVPHPERLPANLYEPVKSSAEKHETVIEKMLADLKNAEELRDMGAEYLAEPLPMSFSWPE